MLKDRRRGYNPTEHDGLFKLNKAMNPKARLAAGVTDPFIAEQIITQFKRLYNGIIHQVEFIKFDLEITALIRLITEDRKFIIDKHPGKWEYNDERYRGICKCFISLRPKTRGFDSKLTRDILINFDVRYMELITLAIQTCLEKGIFPDQFLHTNARVMHTK